MKVFAGSQFVYDAAAYANIRKARCEVHRVGLLMHRRRNAVGRRWASHHLGLLQWFREHHLVRLAEILVKELQEWRQQLQRDEQGVVCGPLPALPKPVTLRDCVGTAGHDERKPIAQSTRRNDMDVKLADLYVTCPLCAGQKMVSDKPAPGGSSYGQKLVMQYGPCPECSGRGGKLTPQGEVWAQFVTKLHEMGRLP